MAKELAAEKAKTALLAKKLRKKRKENEELTASIKNPSVTDSGCSTENSVFGFDNPNRLSSTRNTTTTTAQEESRFLSSMNQLSVASINVPECKSADDEDIHRQTFELWKDLLMDSMKLAGVTPFELMVGWKYRGTFPSMWSGPCGSELDRSELREKDADTKQISKNYADSSRGAKESNIKIGDTVLLAQNKRSKTDPTFSSERFTVIAREGAKIVIMSKTGIQYARNIREVKRAPESITSDNHPEQEKFEEMVSTPDSEIQASGSAKTSRDLRKREVIKRPKRFDDQFVYRVFF
ncbi:uncharacterized protein LOC135707300 [Ochlerotatus camptorhynchus]|uniref:uncharacterized protein LOC135707300 n=1 Tax=Ochlerotatus camptorhynchus TaxID=644619 RepID=UPI0031D41E90